MNRTQQSVLAAAVVLFLAWFSTHFGSLILGPDGVASSEREVCIVLGIVFFLAILFRPKVDTPTSGPRAWLVPAAGVAGLVAVLIGVIFDVKQLDWLGLLLLLYACLQWSLPERFSANLLPAMILLYWVHPIPWQVFGPLQLTLQHLSVVGAEWVAHSLNIAAWADGTILHTETFTVDVPQACSGMTTSIAVLVSCLGTGFLLRIKWHHLAILVVFGLAQTLALNILRISLFTILAPRMPASVSTTFLHDTLGLLLIAGIVLIQVEARLWMYWHTKRVKLAAATLNGEVEYQARKGYVNTFWRYVFRYSVIAVVLVVMLAGIAGLLYKRRPHHRSRMISRLVENNGISDQATAEKAAITALNLDRSNFEARRALAQVLVQRSKNEQAIDELNKIPASSRGVYDIIIRAQSLAGQKRLDEAFELINGLAAGVKQNPSVAMFSAELAAARDDSKCVASNVVIASQAPSSTMLNRIRRMFPYLAAKEEWKAIVDCDRPLPYADPVQAAVVVNALLRMNMIPGMETALRSATQTWPDNPMFLYHLFSLAMLRPDGKWEDLFATSFLHNLPQLNADQLAMYMEYCFQLRRPDLAWLTYSRLSAIDPKDPALLSAASMFSEIWFTFKPQRLGVGSANPNGSVNLKELYLQTQNVWPLSLLWNNVPLAQELADADASVVSKQYIAACIEELERRDKADRLSPRMEALFQAALLRTGRYKDVLLRLDKLEKDAPERQTEWLGKRLVISDLEGDWDASYELSRKLIALTRYSNVAASRSQINALIRLRFSMYALAVAERLHRLAPESPESTQSLILLRALFGSKEDAFALLSEIPGAVRSPLGVQVFYDTERFVEADKMAISSGRTSQTNSPGQQKLVLPMAEVTITPPRPATMPDDEKLDASAEQIEREADKSSSPFVTGVKRLIATWLRCRGAQGSSDQNKWEQVGRDDTERAVSLHNLAVLLIFGNKYAEASNVLARATALLPESPTLWQERVSLSGGDRDVIKMARQAHPANSDLWLAELVARKRDEGPGTWALREIKQATETQKFPVGTIVRAGDFMGRSGMTNAATVAAVYATKNASGLLPASVLGMKSALANGDIELALKCAVQAAGFALDPTPFEKVMVQLQMMKARPSVDLSKMLNKLREQFPEDTQWAERLGVVNFQNNDMSAAFDVLVPMIDKGLMNKMSGRSVLMAAEASHAAGRDDKAVDILEEAYETHTNSPVVLNNLIYTLANNPKTLLRAQALLPRLLELVGTNQSASVFDTAAAVYFKGGRLQLSVEYTRKALKFVNPDDNSAAELRLNAAEIFIRAGEFKDARTQLDIVSKIDHRSRNIEERRRALVVALGTK